MLTARCRKPSSRDNHSVHDAGSCRHVTITSCTMQETIVSRQSFRARLF
ncbi:hypothetical protein HMPREF1555_00844 [Porphyromonas gingivalis F0570]|uniref:Uncharacterized protein n=1 Tax=Porphyromonas gingivalis F0570 TaxID=1227271 RepID=A0A0E2LRQ0_PORGN|nr:hypothetical protein HMPREF1555_00844 [Porphyromonas gingivalis F0570]